MKTHHGYKKVAHVGASIVALMLLMCSTPMNAQATGLSTYTTDTPVVINGITLTVAAGSTALSVTYSATTMRVVVGTGHSFTIKTTDTHNIMNNDGGLSQCKTMTITSGTVVITPGATGCPLPVAPTPTPTPVVVPLVSSTSAPVVSGTPTQSIITPSTPTVSQTPVQTGDTTNIVASTASFTFTKNLKKGMDDGDVAQLEMYLDSHGFPVAPSGWGLLAQPSTVFGSKTVAALKRFQKSINLPATGYFGPMTRAYVNGK